MASTIERLMKLPGDCAYVISTYVIGKEKILLEVDIQSSFVNAPVCSNFVGSATYSACSISCHRGAHVCFRECRCTVGAA